MKGVVNFTFIGPGFKCYGGYGANAEVFNCDDVESGTKYCIKATNPNGTVGIRGCGLPSVIGYMESIGFQIPGCTEKFGYETCVCSKEKCNN